MVTPTADCFHIADEFLAVGTPLKSFLKVLSRMASRGVMTNRICLTFYSFCVQYLLTSAVHTVHGQGDALGHDHLRVAFKGQRSDQGGAAHVPHGVAGQRDIHGIPAVVIYQICHLADGPVFVDREARVLMLLREGCFLVRPVESIKERISSGALSLRPFIVADVDSWCGTRSSLLT